MFPIKLISITYPSSSIWFLKRKNSNEFEGVELKIYLDKSISEYKVTIGLRGIKILAQAHDFDIYVHEKHVTFKEFEEINERWDNNGQK